MSAVIVSLEAECEKIRRQIVDLQHDIDLKRAELRGIIRGIEAVRAEEGAHAGVRNHPQNEVTELPDVTEIRRPAATLNSQTLASEILADLEKLIAQYPKGPTVKQIAEYIGEEEPNVRKACYELNKGGRARFMRRMDSNSYHLFTNSGKPPANELTRAQSSILRVLSASKDDQGMVQRPIREVCDAAEVSKGSFPAVISSLVSKGFIEIGKKGSNSEPNVYRIVEQRD